MKRKSPASAVSFRRSFASFGLFNITIYLVFLCLLCPALTAAQTTYTNPTPINILDSSPANPYPSTINVSNVLGVIQKVTVKLNNFNHTFPSDVDIMLVGPGGQNAIIMSDQGGGNDVSGVNLTLDDAAANPIPAIIVSGTFRPTNDATIDNFPAPAPPPSGGSALSVFSRTNPNGAWRLFVFDDVGADIGTIGGGWELTITIANQFENLNNIVIPDNGTANPYPSAIPVVGREGRVAKLRVQLNGFTHTAPDDADLLLVAPNGRSVVLMSDVGGNNAVSNQTLIFDDSAAGFLPDNAPITAGIYKPTDFEPGEVFPAPAPSSPPTGRTLAALNGSEPNGVWNLFLVDDTGGNAGNITSGWTIIVDSSLTAIFIPTSGIAEPYPSEKIVAGLEGSVTKAVVTINNFNHASPDDADLMLVAPNGRKIILMSDVGGNSETAGINLTFDDDAVSGLPDNAPLVSGTYKPTNFEAGDVFPAPAPSDGTFGVDLRHFYGSPANGSWKLFIVDDTGANFGSISGWDLTLTASVNACAFTLSPNVIAIPASGGSSSFNINIFPGCPWTASTSSGFVTLTSATNGEGNGTIGFTVAANTGAARTGIIEVSNGVQTRTFQIQQGTGCPTSINSTSQNFGATGGSGSVGVTAPGTCNWFAMSNVGWITIPNPNGTGNGTLNFNIAANTTSNPRTGVINFGTQTLVINQAGARGGRFDFDGDGKADVSVFRPSGGNWYVLASQNNSILSVQWGQSGDKVVAADYDGDRKTDFAVYRAGNWYWIDSTTGAFRTVNWGLATDAPVPADYDGDGKADTAVYRSSDGTWQIRRSSNNTTVSVQFGIATDRAVPADFDGDGRADIAVYRAGATQSSWIILRSSNSSVQFSPFGIEGDVPLAGDFDGDGRDNVAVFRPSNGAWYVLNADSTFSSQAWGASGDVPVPADYNGDGRTDYSVFRNGVWYTLFSGGTTFRTDYWGLGTDVPVPSASQ